ALICQVQGSFEPSQGATASDFLRSGQRLRIDRRQCPADTSADAPIQGKRFVRVVLVQPDTVCGTALDYSRTASAVGRGSHACALRSAPANQSAFAASQSSISGAAGCRPSSWSIWVWRDSRPALVALRTALRSSTSKYAAQCLRLRQAL